MKDKSPACPGNTVKNIPLIYIMVYIFTVTVNKVITYFKISISPFQDMGL